MAKTLTIDLYSDVVCPWCYIGERRFSEARDRLSHPTDGAEPIELDVRLHAFQLDPTADPDRTEPVVDAYAAKFGGKQRATEILEQVTAVAAEAGLEFHMDRGLRANTLRAHRLIWWAGQPGSGTTAEEMNERLMRAYFTEGLNISSVDTLSQLAGEIGADPAAAKAMLESDEGTAEVEHDLASAAEIGVSAVPTFVVDEAFAIPGAVEPERFVELLRNVASREA